MTATAQQAPPFGQSVVLNNISWKEYLRLGRLLADRPLRMTYDRGALEIMTLSSHHERLKQILRTLVMALAEELGILILGFGSMTCKRQKKRRGFEPDECFWVANAGAVRGKTRIDLRVDPPPDLGIEVDVSSSSLNRMAIYGALGVPEVWRFVRQTLAFHELQPNGKYAEIPTSLAFPNLASADLMPFLTLGIQQGELDMLQAFRAWVRQRFGGSTTSP